MLLRPFLNDKSSCASYLFGCTTHAQLAVVDPHADLVDGYLATAEAIGAPVPRFVHIPTDLLFRMVPKMAEWCEINFQYHNVISNEAARRDLGFDPKISWSEGARALRGLTEPSQPEMLAKYQQLLAAWEEATRNLPRLE